MSVQTDLFAYGTPPETGMDTPDLDDSTDDTNAVDGKSDAVERNEYETDQQQDGDIDESPLEESTNGIDPAVLSVETGDYRRSDVLKHFHVERGFAAERIAREVFNGEVTGETIRNWLEKRGIKASTGSLLSLSAHTGAAPMAQLGEIARKNGDSMVETSLDEILEKYADQVSRESALK